MEGEEIILHEFVIGQEKDPGMTESNDGSTVNIAYLITEPIKEVTLYTTEVENGMLDEDQEVLSKIIINEFEFYPRSGIKQTQTLKSKRFVLHKPRFFDRIELQQTRYLKPSSKKYSRQISYLRLQQGDQSIQVGRKKEEVPCEKNMSIILPVEEVNEPCLISAVGVDDDGICSLQIISAIDCIPDDIPRHLYSYGHSKAGVVMLDKTRRGDKKYGNEGDGFGGMNFEDPSDFDILGFVKKHYQYMTYGYATQSQLLELYDVLGRTINDENENVIYSLFRLERHLRWRVFHSLKGKGYVDSDPLLRLKLYRIVQCLSKTVEKSKAIRDIRPSMNCYAIACIGE